MHQKILQKLKEKDFTTNKSFSKFIKHFLTNEGLIGNSGITLIHKNKIMIDEKQLTKLFNSYINTVEKSSCTKLKTFGINFENTSVQFARDIVNS